MISRKQIGYLKYPFQHHMFPTIPCNLYIKHLYVEHVFWKLFGVDKLCDSLYIISYLLQIHVYTKFQVLLEKLFSLFEQDEDKLLKQNEWIEFLKGRLT